MKIGVFDSGIGGVTVLKEIIKILPHENYIYYSDSRNNPYGDKSDEEIINICDNITKFLIEKECKIIVIACNTASAKAVSFLRDKYKNIIFVAIEPAYKMIYDYAYNDTVLVMATKGTIESEKFNLLYNKYNNNKTILLPCVGLADIIEQGNEKKIDEYLEKKLKIYNGKVQSVVLGCTHYQIIKEKINYVLGGVKFFYGAGKLAENLKKILEINGCVSQKGGSLKFIDTQGNMEKENRFFELLKK